MSEKPLRPVRPGPLAEGRATDPYRVGVDPASPVVPAFRLEHLPLVALGIIPKGVQRLRRLVEHSLERRRKSICATQPEALLLMLTK